METQKGSKGPRSCITCLNFVTFKSKCLFVCLLVLPDKTLFPTPIGLSVVAVVVVVEVVVEEMS